MLILEEVRELVETEFAPIVERKRLQMELEKQIEQEKHQHTTQLPKQSPAPGDLTM